MPNIHIARRVLLGAPAVVAPPSFTSPLDLPNLYAWYKGDAGVTAHGNIVSSWADQSGVSGVAMAGGTGTGIRNDLSTLNSKVVLTDNGGSSALSGTLSIGGTQVSVWALVRATSTSSGRVAGYGVAGSDTGATAFIAAYFASTTDVRGYNNGDKSTGTVSNATWNTIASIWDGTNHTLYINNTGGTPVASTPTFAASGQFTLFNATNFGNELVGDIAEIVVVKGAMSSTDRSNMAAYSLAKWGV
jgi:hypothetical protein